MPSIYSRLKWVEETTVNKHVFICFDSEDVQLGKLEKELIITNKQWCWIQATGISVRPRYLHEIRNKQKELYKLRI